MNEDHKSWNCSSVIQINERFKNHKKKKFYIRHHDTGKELIRTFLKHLLVFHGDVNNEKHVNDEQKNPPGRCMLRQHISSSWLYLVLAIELFYCDPCRRKSYFTYDAVKFKFASTFHYKFICDQQQIFCRTKWDSECRIYHL